MLTTRISPKMSEKPLATMKRSAAKVMRVEQTCRGTAPGLSIAEPKFVVRQLPTSTDRIGDHDDVQDREADETGREHERNRSPGPQLSDTVCHATANLPSR